MVATMSRNRICMTPMRLLNIHPRGFIFSPWGGRGGKGRLRMKVFYSCVPIMFLVCSHMFSIMFPKFPMCS
jgi:hypothetical protein